MMKSPQKLTEAQKTKQKSNIFGNECNVRNIYPFVSEIKGRRLPFNEILIYV